MGSCKRSSCLKFVKFLLFTFYTNAFLDVKMVIRNRLTAGVFSSGGINEMERPRGEGEYDLLLWWGSVVYITSSSRTVQLGSQQRLYERSRLKSKSGRHQPHRRECTVKGHSTVLYASIGFLLGQCRPQAKIYQPIYDGFI